MKVCPVLSNRIGLEKKDSCAQNKLRYLNDCFERTKSVQHNKVSFGWGGISPQVFESPVIKDVGFQILNGKVRFSEKIILTVKQFADLIQATEGIALRHDHGEFGRLIHNDFDGIQNTSLFQQIINAAKRASEEKLGKNSASGVIDMMINN